MCGTLIKSEVFVLTAVCCFHCTAETDSKTNSTLEIGQTAMLCLVNREVSFQVSS